MSDKEVAILMAYALMAGTWGICAIAREVILAKFILSRRLSQTCPSIGQDVFERSSHCFINFPILPFLWIKEHKIELVTLDLS